MSLLDDHLGNTQQGPNWSRINQWLLWIGVAAAVGWLLFRHNEHLLPFLILLACPLMHLFRHGGHGGHGGPREDTDTAPEAPSPDAGHVH